MTGRENYQNHNNNSFLIENNKTESINQLETTQQIENYNNMMEIDNYFVNDNIFSSTETLLNQKIEDSYKMIELHVNTLLTDSNDFFDKQEIRRTKSYSDLSQSVWEIEIDNIIEYNDQSLLDLDLKDVYKQKIKIVRESTSQRENTSDTFKECNCYCCKNYLTIHDENIWDYLNKYNIKNNEIIPRSSNSIKRLYMLRPDIFIHRNLKEFRFLKNLNLTSIVTNQSYEFKYEIWMWNNGYPESVVTCSFCEKEFCSNHLDYNPFVFKNCKCCSKTWSICSWCLFDSFNDCIIESKMTEGLTLLNEEIFCEILHKK